MPEQSTEFTLMGLVGLIFGLMVVVVFFGFIFVGNILTTVADSKQTEQFETLVNSIEQVCGSQYHSPVYGITITVFEEYAIKYKEDVNDFSDPDKVNELGCSSNCLCLLRNNIPLQCKAMISFKQTDCKNIDVKQTTLLLNKDLSMPYSFFGTGNPKTCKYRLDVWWDEGDVVVGGETQEITTAPGKGTWVPIGHDC